MWELECLVPLLLIQGGGGAGGMSRSWVGGRPAAVLVGDPMAALASTLHGPHEVLFLLALRVTSTKVQILTQKALVGAADERGLRFTCFTRTKVQILTQKAVFRG